MPEEAEVVETQVEETGMDEVVDQSTDVSETTDDVTESDTQSVDIGNVNLDDIRNKYADNPEVVKLAEQLMGDYTRKTQSAAEQRRQAEATQQAFTQWAQQAQSKIEDLEKKLSGDSDEETPDFSNMTEGQVAKWLEDRLGQRMMGQVQQMLQPMQEKMAVSSYKEEMDNILKQDSALRDLWNSSPEVKQRAAQIATNGLSVNAAMKAAAYDDLKAKLDKLVGQRNQKKASAAKQTIQSGSDVATKQTSMKVRPWEEVRDEQLRRLEAGEFDSA